MRLIDADVLVDSLSKRYNEKVGVVPDNLAEGFVQVEKLIKEQPLVYDLNNVVEELEELLNPEIEKKRCVSTSCEFDNNCTNCVLKYAIDIVKRGCADK